MGYSVPQNNMATSNASISMEDVLRAKFGESSSKIKANIRQFESEVIELEAELEVPRETTGAERVCIEAMLRCQMEFETYASLLSKGYVAMVEFENKKRELELELNTINAKMISTTGESMAKFL
jgi:hypothetical protein